MPLSYCIPSSLDSALIVRKHGCQVPSQLDAQAADALAISRAGHFKEAGNKSFRNNDYVIALWQYSLVNHVS